MEWINKDVTAASSNPRVRLAWWVFILGLACRLFFAFTTPLNGAPDEAAHLNYVVHLHDEHALPIQPQLRRLDPAGNDWEYYQPPLYYLAALPVYAAARAAGVSDLGMMWALRMLSVLLWVAVFVASERALRRICGADDWFYATALGLIHLLPTYVFMSSMFNNDNLATLAGAVLCLRLLRCESIRDAAAAAVVCGLGMWTKQSAIVLVVAAGCRFLLAGWMGRAPLRDIFAKLAVLGGVFALMWAPLVAWNVRHYGSLTGESYYFEYLRSAWRAQEVASYVIKTFVATAGGFNEIIFAPRVVTALAFCILGAGFAWDLVSRRRMLVDDLLRERGYLAALVPATLLMVFFVLRLGMMSGMGQGRHLFPALLPLGCYLALAARALFRPRPGGRATWWSLGAMSAYLVAFAVFVYVHIRPGG